MSIKDKMRTAYAKLDGGLFSVAQKADVGDAAQRMAEQGVAMMSWADPFMPDPSIPEIVKERAIKLLQDGTPSHYRMPIGDYELRCLLAKRIARQYGLQLDPSRNLIINPGSDVGLYLAMAPWINPGDEVMVHDPSYPSNFLNAELLGGVTVHVPTYAKDGYHLDISEYEQRVTAKTKMVVLTNPNNPTAVCYTKEELLQLAQFCVRHDFVCVVDQAFEDTVFAPHEMVCMAQLPGMWERTVTVCSISKGMGLSGFRIGWIYADDVIMDTYYGCAVNLQGAANTLAQEAVKPVILEDGFIETYKKKYDERRQYAYKLFNSIPGVSMFLPEAGFYSWIDVHALGESGAIVDYLVKEAKVSVNDGAFYGEEGKGYLRLIHGCYYDNAKSYEAMERMAKAFRQLAKEKGPQ